MELDALDFLFDNKEEMGDGVYLYLCNLIRDKGRERPIEELSNEQITTKIMALQRIIERRSRAARARLPENSEDAINRMVNNANEQRRRLLIERRIRMFESCHRVNSAEEIFSSIV